MSLKRLSLAILFCCITMLVSAQKYEIGIAVGLSGYKGDLEPTANFGINKPAYGIILRKNFDPRNTIRLSYNSGSIGGSDLDSKDELQKLRAAEFTSTINEIALIYEFNFKSFNPQIRGEVFAPYLFTGLTAFDFNPKNNGQELQQFGNNSSTPDGNSVVKYRQRNLAIPLGAGIKWNIYRRFNLTAEFGYRYTLTDYIDDVGGYYAKDDAQSGFTKGMQRGDLRKNDTYMFGLLGITYTFVSSRCPTFY